MKKIYLLSGIVCILLLVLAFTSLTNVKTRERNVNQPTALKTDQPWFSYYFYAVNALSEGQIRSKQMKTEAWYTDFLRANEITRHEVNYVWEKLAGSTSVSAVYNLKAFLTPAATLKSDKSSGIAVDKPDPPSTPPPPPPETTWY